jgi:hypothetical protein
MRGGAAACRVSTSGNWILVLLGCAGSQAPTLHRDHRQVLFKDCKCFASGTWCSGCHDLVDQGVEGQGAGTDLHPIWHLSSQRYIFYWRFVHHGCPGRSRETPGRASSSAFCAACCQRSMR